jgi:CheY-like chemotaxis protein
MDEPVLFVDDEPHLLEGIARALHSRFRVRTATSGAEGLHIVETAGPFAVVVSDMRMPEMDGVQFLSKVRDLCPDTVRIILSGQSDLLQAIAAVNEGNIFRFLSKPCSTQVLRAAVGTGVEQYQLIVSERELLEKTLTGAVNMLIEILGQVAPAAHGRARRLQRYVTALASALKLRDRWQWPLAALVSQIGCVSLPKDTLSKVEAGQELTDEEQRLYESHPQIAAHMLESIPRLEDVAAIVAAQNSPLTAEEISGGQKHWDVRSAGRILLRAAVEFDRQILHGNDAIASAVAIRRVGSGLPDTVIDALRLLPIAAREFSMRTIRVPDLAPGMILDEPLLTLKGVCLVPAGHEVTSTLLLRLRGINEAVRLKEPFRVRVPI